MPMPTGRETTRHRVDEKNGSLYNEIRFRAGGSTFAAGHRRCRAIGRASACRCRHRLERDHQCPGGQRRGQQSQTAHPSDGACRDVRRDQHGAKSLHPRDRDASGRTGCVGRSCGRDGRAADPHPDLPGTESQDRRDLRGIAEGDPGRARQDRRHQAGYGGGRGGPGRPRQRRHQRPRHLPAAHDPWGLRADDAAAVGAICAREAVGAQERRPVPAWPAAGTVERGVGPRLQRGQEPRRHQEHGAYS